MWSTLGPIETATAARQKEGQPLPAAGIGPQHRLGGEYGLIAGNGTGLAPSLSGPANSSVLGGRVTLPTMAVPPVALILARAA